MNDRHGCQLHNKWGMNLHLPSGAGARPPILRLRKMKNQQRFGSLDSVSGRLERE